MNSSEWKHDYLCCSDECGNRFYHSQKHKELELKKTDEQIKSLFEYRVDVKNWSSE